MDDLLPEPEEQLDPLLYYDLERYLFEKVSPRFLRQHWLSAFDLFSIIIWKSNRSKSKLARKLIRIAGVDDLDSIAKLLTGELYDAKSPKARFSTLFKDWEIPLPMTSAILSVLYPSEFTVYDRRLCDQVGNFHRLVNRCNVENLWSGYQDFKKAVEEKAPDRYTLREKDKYLFGESVASQLRNDIERAFD